MSPPDESGPRPGRQSQSVGPWRTAARRLWRNYFALAGLAIIVVLSGAALFAPRIAPYPYDQADEDHQLEHHFLDPRHPLGADFLGRDLLSRLLYGARVSLAVAFASTLLSLFVGTAFGSISGYIGGRLDNLMMRFVDLVYSFPDLLLIILINASINRASLSALLSRPGLAWIKTWLDPDLLALLLALSLVSWVYVARLIRGEVLRLREETYVEAARALGVGHAGIVLRHLLPNTLGPLIVTLTFRVPSVILSESTLSFIGLGIQPPKSSWGTLAADGWTSLQFYPHLIFYPALAIFTVMLAFNFLGDGLRDALAPERRS